MYMEIRDKLFTEEQYLSQLKLYNEEILYYEQLHRSGKHIGYDSLFNFRLRSLLVQFSVGKNLEDLKGNYMEIIRIMPRFGLKKDFILKCYGCYQLASCWNMMIILCKN